MREGRTDERLSVRVSVEMELDASAAFNEFVEELSDGLASLGVTFDKGPDGRISQGRIDIGRVIAWVPGKEIGLEWYPASWNPELVTKIEVTLEAIPKGTRVTVEHHDWGRVLDNAGSELTGWFAREVVSSLFLATSPGRFGDWLTDRRARRPSGSQARAGYRDPLYHRPNFRVILKTLKLTPNDHLLEVGCGGGALLEEALRSGCSAAGIDHSPDMVRLAREVNSQAVNDHRLEIREAEADKLPYPDSAFTCATMTNVFGFISDPVKVLGEMRRVLANNGRLVIFTVSPEMRGTMAAPEPMASRIHFYNDKELEQLARKAGFHDAKVERPDLSEFAKEAEIPEEHRGSFSGPGGQLLVAHKS